MKFTPTQRRIARLLLLARRDSSIALEVGISENAVKCQAHQMFNITQTNNRVRLAIEILRSPELLSEVYKLEAA